MFTLWAAPIFFFFNLHCIILQSTYVVSQLSFLGGSPPAPPLCLFFLFSFSVLLLGGLGIRNNCAFEPLDSYPIPIPIIDYRFTRLPTVLSISPSVDLPDLIQSYLSSRAEN